MLELSLVVVVGREEQRERSRENRRRRGKMFLDFLRLSVATRIISSREMMYRFGLFLDCDSK
jgi:hypothetical protein